MNRICSVALAASLALAAYPARAQAPSAQPAPASQSTAAAVVPPDQQATPDQIRKFFEVARLHQQMQMMMGMMPQMITQAYRVEMKNIEKSLPPGRQLTPQESAALGRIMQEYMQKAMTLYSVDDMIADAIPIYQRHISRTDADALIAFYSSPAGQHILDAQPVIMREYMPIEMSRVLNRSKRLTSQMTADMQNCVKSSQTQTTPAPANPE
jgi:uncharacterized protein